jgi:hypothetical protein
LPATLRIGDATQRGDQVMLDDYFLAGGSEFGLGGGGRPAEWANERFFCWIPLRFAPTGGAGKFLLRYGFALRLKNPRSLLWRRGLGRGGL